jgi:hypothetical protein
MESYMMEHKVFIVTSSAFLVVLVLLWTDYIIELSLRVAASTDTTGYLSNLKKQKYDKLTKGFKCVRKEELRSNRHCMESLPC